LRRQPSGELGEDTPPQGGKIRPKKVGQGRFNNCNLSRVYGRIAKTVKSIKIYPLIMRAGGDQRHVMLLLQCLGDRERNPFRTSITELRM
jgi:hypothetical protein